MSEPPEKRPRCEAHGMAYDPNQHEGCILCRREQGTSEEHDPNPRSRVATAIVALLGAAAIGGIGLGIVGNQRRVAVEAEISEALKPDVDSPGADAEHAPMLGRAGVDDDGYPNDLPDKIALLELLRQKRYAQLSGAIEGFQTAADEDFRHEEWPEVAMSAFDSADRHMGRRIDGWVKATPDSFVPHLARAHHRIARASRAVAGEASEANSPKRRERARRLLEGAKQDVARSLELRPAQAAAYAALLSIASRLGAETDTKTKVFDEAVGYCEDCFGIRAAYLESLSPQWGGSYASMEAAAEAWQASDGNPRFRELLGFADADRCALAVEDSPEDALAFCDRALSQGDRAAIHTTRGVALQRLGRLEDSVDALTVALEERPQDVDALHWRGDSLLALERYEAAARDYALVMKLDPGDQDAETKLAHILGDLSRKASYQIEAGEIDAAISNLDQILELHPRYPDAYAFRGRAYAAAGKASEAERDLLQAIKIDPTNLEAHRALDDVLFREKRFDEIVGYWNRYLRRKPKDATALFERGGAYFYKGDIKLAIRDVTAACKLGNNDACATRQRLPAPE